jgi:hypothetical protein
MTEKEPGNPQVQVLNKKFDPSAVSEGSLDAEYTSYSVNKGESIVLCLMNGETREMMDDNTMMYVYLHEVAHIAEPTVGHTSDFWETFRWILKYAITIKIYNPVDYSYFPKKYCGIEIKSNVLYE